MFIDVVVPSNVFNLGQCILYFNERRMSERTLEPGMKFLATEYLAELAFAWFSHEHSNYLLSDNYLFVCHQSVSHGSSCKTKVVSARAKSELIFNIFLHIVDRTFSRLVKHPFGHIDFLHLRPCA